MTKKKTKVNIQPIKPIVMKELNSESPIKSAYKPIVFESIVNLSEIPNQKIKNLPTIIETIPEIIEEPSVESIIENLIIITEIPKTLDLTTIPETDKESEIKSIISENQINILKSEIDKLSKDIKNLSKKPIKDTKIKKVSEPIKELLEIVKKDQKLDTSSENIDKNIQHHDILLYTLPFEVRNFINMFVELSKNPFELRYKSTKVFDSRKDLISDIIFDPKYLIISKNKYQYSNLRIINK